jgi:hypothetical protein
MKKLFLHATIALFTVCTATTGLAKDKDKDKDQVILTDRDGRRYYVDRDGKRHWVDDGDRKHDHRSDDRDGRRDDGGSGQDRSRSIYVIERDRPVERIVFVDSDGRYYRLEGGRRTYIRDHYYESYPSKYYYPDGRRRITITLPF